VILFVAVPVAGAKSFEMKAASGEFSYRGVARFDSMVIVESISTGAQLSGPRELAQSIQCIDGKQLRTCIKIVKGTAPVELRVLAPITVSLHRPGSFTLTIRRATMLTNVWVSGCGQVGLRGAGTYQADGGVDVTYVAKDKPTNLRLK
jgi:hypothetical protein